MKIGFTATMSCGKTTLVKELAKLEVFKDYFIATERSQYLKSLGIPLNTDSTVNGQIIFMAERSSELLHENLITDRTIWDVLAFTRLSYSIGTHQKVLLEEASELLMDQYDYVFYISPEGIGIEDNGIRETDPIYRQRIDIQIKSLLNDYVPKNLITISGSTEDRIKQVLHALHL